MAPQSRTSSRNNEYERIEILPVLNNPSADYRASAHFSKGRIHQRAAIGAFGFDDGTLRGISSLFATANCIEANSDGSPASLDGEDITGTAFRYVKPDIGFKYTVIHELGHTFGLCHVNGLLRIMFTNAANQKKSIWSWPSAWQYWTNGVEAGFTLEEGKKAWDYIVANFAPAQLQVRPF